MGKRGISRELRRRLRRITAKRPKRVVEHILKHGHVTTEELRTQYGYQHPPRAARDVREQGIPPETFRVKSSSGRSIGAYRFGDLSAVEAEKLGGRTVIPKPLKEECIAAYGSRCCISGDSLHPRYLQVDHRVPYEVSGEPAAEKRAVADYMLLCGSCNRAKSWSCEHCPNWLAEKSADVCRACYWASPGAYRHVALREVRRLDVVWSEQEVQVYDRLRQLADEAQQAMPEYVKAVLSRHVRLTSAGGP
jgi:5-methylcytosine-specific restriction endonuclease McrA